MSTDTKYSFHHGILEANGLALYHFADEAKKIVDGLTPFEIHYASDPARGSYQGFAALHDLCDASTMLPGVDSGANLPGEDDACGAFWEAVMSEVTRLILLHERVNPATITTKAAELLGGLYGTGASGQHHDICSYFFGNWELVTTQDEAENFCDYEDIQLGTDQMTPGDFGRFYCYLRDEGLLPEPAAPAAALAKLNTEHLTKAAQCAALLAADIQTAHSSACAGSSLGEMLLSDQLLNLIGEARVLEYKLERLRSLATR